MKKDKIKVMDTDIRILNVAEEKYISLTDIAKKKNLNDPKDVIKNWMRNKFTIEFLGLWEKLYNENFKEVEFDPVYNEAGKNYFTMSPTKWIKLLNARGIKVQMGRDGSTYAHEDIAFEFASWISVEFKLYLIKEFQRLKKIEMKNINECWEISRFFSKINYKIHTEAIQSKLIPKRISNNEMNKIYSNEAEISNMALFGMDSKTWRSKNKYKKGNIRDNANISQLICLANLESLNSILIKDGVKTTERLIKLNSIAIDQMKILVLNNKINEKIKLE